jgi:hypothetical protein
MVSYEVIPSRWWHYNYMWIWELGWGKGDPANTAEYINYIWYANFISQYHPNKNSYTGDEHNEKFSTQYLITLSIDSLQILMILDIMWHCLFTVYIMLELATNNSAMPIFNVISEVSLVRPWWKKWLCSFQIYFAGKFGLSDADVKRGHLFHKARPDIQFWLGMWRSSRRRGCYSSKCKFSET